MAVLTPNSKILLVLQEQRYIKEQDFRPQQALAAHLTHLAASSLADSTLSAGSRSGADADAGASGTTASGWASAASSAAPHFRAACTADVG